MDNPPKTSKMELCAKIVDDTELLTIFLRDCVLDVPQCDEHASDNTK